MRAMFEIWWYNTGHDKADLKRNADGYENRDVEHQWEAWAGACNWCAAVMGCAIQKLSDEVVPTPNGTGEDALPARKDA